ncbi:hypothetical protein J6590_062926 [Homalodisca vitripennis]|nr:hypothetical protein J6590_062926 [Homalodisca vitripennis]
MQTCDKRCCKSYFEFTKYTRIAVPHRLASGDGTMMSGEWDRDQGKAARKRSGVGYTILKWGAESRVGPEDKEGPRILREPFLPVLSVFLGNCNTLMAVVVHHLLREDKLSWSCNDQSVLNRVVQAACIHGSSNLSRELCSVARVYSDGNNVSNACECTILLIVSHKLVQILTRIDLASPL